MDDDTRWEWIPGLGWIKGYEPRCLWCGGRLPDKPEGDYCSTLCVAYAERDSAEDND